MGTVEVGDLVFGRDGKPTSVVAKSPVFYDHVCYRMCFDVDEIIADAEHLWIIDEYQNRHQPRIMTTQEIVNTSSNRTVHAILKSTYLDYPEKSLICQPYAFGVWLGDGDKRHGNLACTDEAIHENLRALGYDVYVTQEDSSEWKSAKLRQELRELGFARQTNPVEKYIPAEYLQASASQRLQLLWGLMDTDGNASSDRGYCSICMTNFNLMCQIEELVRSLGIKVTLRESIATCTQTGAQCQKYNLKWTTPIKMFTLPYKLALQKRNGFRGTQSKHYIKQALPVDSVPTQCIQVNNEEHCYLAGRGLIPTHNSVYLLTAALQYVDVPGYSAILFRRTFSDLMLPGALIPMSQEWLSPFLASGEVRWQDKEKRYTFLESGATVTFGYLDAKGDELRYQGAEFQFVGMDEVTHIAPNAYTYLFSRLRRLLGSNIPIRMRATANPGGPYGDYYYNRFFVEKKDSRIFLPAGLKDNPYLDAEEYRQSLAELDPITREQLENGNWEIRPKGDLFDKSWILVIDSRSIPEYARRVRFWDLASIDPKYRKKNTNTREPDSTVGFKLSFDKGKYYIEDIIKVKKAPGDLEELIKQTAEADGKSCAIRMEEEGGASGAANIHRYSKLLQGYDFTGVKPVVSKIERARPVAAAAQVGSLFLSNRCRYITDFYSQLDAFPNGINDDIIDGLSGSFNYFTSKASAVYAPSKQIYVRQQATESNQVHARRVYRDNGSYWLNSMSR